MNTQLQNKVQSFLPVNIVKIVSNSKGRITMEATPAGKKDDPRYENKEFFYISGVLHDFIKGETIIEMNKQLEEIKKESKNNNLLMFLDGFWSDKHESCYLFSGFIDAKAYNTNRFELISYNNKREIYLSGEIAGEILMDKDLDVDTLASSSSIGLSSGEVKSLLSCSNNKANLLNEIVMNPAHFEKNSTLTKERFTRLKRCLSDIKMYRILHQYSYLRLIGLSRDISVKVLNKFEDNSRNAILKNPSIISQLNYSKDGKVSLAGHDDKSTIQFVKVISSLRYKGYEESIYRSIAKEAMANMRKNGNLASPIIVNHTDPRFEFTIIAEVIRLKMKLEGEFFNLQSESRESIMPKISYARNVLFTASQHGDLFKINKIDSTSNTYLFGFCSDYNLEEKLANNISRLSDKNILDVKGVKDFNITKYVDNPKIIPYEAQVDAVKQTLDYKLSIVTGGPGVGKTTVQKIILAALEDNSNKRLKFRFVAPSGKAATRITESLYGDGANSIPEELKGKTIDSLIRLQYTGKPVFNTERKLDLDVIIIDEFSMADTEKLNYLFDALPDHAKVIISGDKDQLASVEPGNVLSDLIASKCVPFTVLNETKRQGDESDIVPAAYDIIANKMPDLKLENDTNVKDLIFVPAENDDDILNHIDRLISQKITLEDNYSMDDIQVIAARTKSSEGASCKTINDRIRKFMNPKYGNRAFDIADNGKYYIGDRIMCIKNESSKQVMNGNQGVIVNVNKRTHKTHVKFDHLDEELVLETADILSYNKFSISFAMSIHKSQGSEYPVVIIPISNHPGDKKMLSAQLLYTAATRGKSMVYLVGSKDALKLAISKKEEVVRYGFLKSIIENSMKKLPDNLIRFRPIIIGGEAVNNNAVTYIDKKDYSQENNDNSEYQL